MNKFNLLDIFPIWIWISIIIIIFLYIYLFNKNNNLKKSNINIYYFYAEWCPHCKHFKSEWNKFIGLLDNSTVNIITINDCEDSYLCNKYNIEGFPTIIFEKNNNFIKYDNKLTSIDLLNYLKNINL